MPQVEAFINSRSRSDLIPASQLEGCYFDELAEIIEPLVEKTSKVNVVYAVEPENGNEIREQYLTALAAANFQPGSIRHPGFTYKNTDPGFDRVEVETAIEKVEALAAKTATDQIKNLGCQLALAKLADDLSTVALIEGVKTKNDRQTASAVIKKFGGVSPELAAEAAKLRVAMMLRKAGNEERNQDAYFTPQQQEELGKAVFDATDCAKAFSWGLEQYGLLAQKPGDYGFLVDIIKDCTSIDVRDKYETGHSTVVIPQTGGKRTGKALLSLIAHEVSAHARQSATCAKVFGFFGGFAGKIDDEVLYEGEAKFYDEAFSRKGFGIELDTPLPWYITAIQTAQLGLGFDVIFAELLTRMKLIQPDPARLKSLANTAYRTTQRVLRGVTDINNPCGYAFTKDKAYLEGWLARKQLEAAGYGDYNLLTACAPDGLRFVSQITIDPDFSWPYPLQEDLPFKYFQAVLQEDLRQKLATQGKPKTPKPETTPPTTPPTPPKRPGLLKKAWRWFLDN